MKLFLLKSKTFGLGQTNWANKFWCIWGIFGRITSTHFGTVSPLSMFSIIQLLCLQKNLSLYIHIWDWDLNLCCKELGILPSRVRSPWVEFSHPILKNYCIYSSCLNLFVYDKLSLSCIEHLLKGLPYFNLWSKHIL